MKIKQNAVDADMQCNGYVYVPSIHSTSLPPYLELERTINLIFKMTKCLCQRSLARILEVFVEFILLYSYQYHSCSFVYRNVCLLFRIFFDTDFVFFGFTKRCTLNTYRNTNSGRRDAIRSVGAIRSNRSLRSIRLRAFNFSFVLTFMCFSIDRTKHQNMSGEMSTAGQEPILPAVLEFPETHQEAFLRQVISDLDVNVPNFKLAPVYTLYLCARYAEPRPIVPSHTNNSAFPSQLDIVRRRIIVPICSPPSGHTN